MKKTLIGICFTILSGCDSKMDNEKDVENIFSKESPVSTSNDKAVDDFISFLESSDLNRKANEKAVDDFIAFLENSD